MNEELIMPYDLLEELLIGRESLKKTILDHYFVRDIHDIPLQHINYCLKKLKEMINDEQR